MSLTALRATLVEIKKQKVPPFQFHTEKKKGERDKRRGYRVILKGCLSFFVYSSVRCPLSLGEKCKGLLCGAKLHPVWSSMLLVHVGVDEV